MNVKRIAFIVVLASVSAVWATGDTSDPALVFMRPETSSFWRTATGRTMTLPIDFPREATTATLVVRGSSNYQARYENIVADTFVLTLPQADNLAQEAVYELELSFDDGTVRRTRLGLIAGLAAGGEGTTRCLMDSTSRKWKRIPPHGVMPVPHGATALTVGGETIVDGANGYTGAQGWYALSNFAAGETVQVSLTADGRTAALPLTVWTPAGLILLVR